MKVKLLETVQGAGISGTLLKSGAAVTILETGGEYEVDDSLGVWLLEHRKAEEVKEAPHYGAQKEPALRHDDELYEVMTRDTEVQADAADIMTTENQATTKKPKRGKK